MIIDMHTHGKLTKCLPFSREYTLHLFANARKEGLDAICLTEHFNTIEFDLLYRFLLAEGQPSGDSFIVNGLRIFPGIEVDVKEGGHCILLGKIENVFLLHEQLQPYMEEDSYISLSDLFTLGKEKSMIIAAAHPFREGSQLHKMDLSLLRQFDFLDLNGKDCAVFGEENRRKVTELSSRCGVEVLAGSDTHQAFQFGSVYNTFFDTIETFEQMKNAIVLKRYESSIAELCIQKVEHAIVLKKALKYISALGGDYCSVLNLSVSGEAV